MLTCGSIFSGGGGFDCGALYAGIKPVWGIEYDRKLASLYQLNFGHDPYQDLLTADPRNYSNVDLLHLSPPCVNFSGAKNNATELAIDIELIKKCCEFIDWLNPSYVTIENVPEYVKSCSYKVVIDCLQAHGYSVLLDIVDAADFGAATNRKRAIVRASKNHSLPLLFPTHSHIASRNLFGDRQLWRSWWDAIADIFADLPDSELTKNQQYFLDEFALKNDRYPTEYLIQRTGYRKRGTNIRFRDRPCWTLLASMGDDRHGGNRNHVINAVFGGNVVKSLNARALARIQSFPDWYELPIEFGASTLYRAIGNSVPPLLAAAICRSLASHSIIGSRSQLTDLKLATISV